MIEREYDYKSLTRRGTPSPKQRKNLEWKDMTEAEQIEKLKKELSVMESRLSRLTIPNRSGMPSGEKTILYACLVMSLLSLPISLVCWSMLIT